MVMKHTQTRRCAGFSGNLDRPGEGTVRPETTPLVAAKSRRRGLVGLAGSRENRYISRNLWFSYDRVLRVGPSGPALFYYPNEPPQINDAGLARVAQPGRPEGPASTQCKLDQFDPGHDRSNRWFRGRRSACRAAPGGRAGHGGAGIGGRRTGIAGNGLPAGAYQDIRRIRLHRPDHGGTARRIDADRRLRSDLKGAVAGT